MTLIKKIFFSLLLLTIPLRGDEFRYEAPPNFGLFNNYVAVHHPVTTNNPIAQQYFDQGLTQIYAFNHEAAYWSFQKATEIDPNMAMAYWGMALALGMNINIAINPEREKIAYETIQKGVQLSDKVTQNEKDYILTLAKRYTNDPKADFKQLDKDYSKGMKELSEKYPDDLDATTLFTESIIDLAPWKQWDANGNPNQGTLEAVYNLQSVLKRIRAI